MLQNPLWADVLQKRGLNKRVSSLDLTQNFRKTENAVTFKLYYLMCTSKHFGNKMSQRIIFMLHLTGMLISLRKWQETACLVKNKFGYRK